MLVLFHWFTIPRTAHLQNSPRESQLPEPPCPGSVEHVDKAADHQLEAHNLLTEAWTKDNLRLFFGDRPVAEWFNKAAPKVKSGEVVPERIDGETALTMMVNDPLLIRRPLIQVGERREVGFDIEIVNNWVGLEAVDETQ